MKLSDLFIPLAITGVVTCFVNEGNPMSLIVCGAMAWAVWQVGKGLR